MSQPATQKAKRRYTVNRRSAAQERRQDGRRAGHLYDPPTDALPGSREKMAVLARRLKAGLPLHSPGDVVTSADVHLNFARIHRGNQLLPDADEPVAEGGGGDNVEKIKGETFGARLRRARLRAGLSVRGLAREAGLDRRLVQLAEAGRQAPLMTTLLALAAALGVSVHWLATGRPT